MIMLRIISVFYLLLIIIVKLQAQGIDISTGSSITVSGNATIEITNGNFINNGTYTMGTETFTFSGTSNGNISGTSNNDIYNLNENNSNGITINGPGYLAINNTLVFSNGLINTGNNFIILNDNVTVSGASNTKYINGTCRKTGNDAFTFPIGKNGKYAPIGISAPSDISDHFTASYYNESPNSLYNVSLLGSGLAVVSTTEYWILDKTNGNSSVSVTLHWDSQSEVTQISDLKVAQWDDTQWKNVGNASTTGDNSSGTITSNVMNKFSPFTLGSSTTNNPLPVNLLNFTASCNNNIINIQWSTASETDCDYFIIEKLYNGESFTQIATIPGNGNSNHIINYQITDDISNNQIAYYRLSQVDYSGYKNVMNNMITHVNCNMTNNEINIFQDDEGSNVIVNSSNEVIANIRIFDLSGKIISNGSKTLFAGENKINTSDINLAKGMYFVNIQTSDFSKSSKIILK